MQGYIPYSDEFMYQDPECIDEYREWQQFAKFLLIDEKLHKQQTNKVTMARTLLRPPGNRRRLKRYRTRLTLPN